MTEESPSVSSRHPEACRRVTFKGFGKFLLLFEFTLDFYDIACYNAIKLILKGRTMSKIFETEEDSYSIDDIPKEKRYLNTVSYDYSVEYIYNLIKKKKIILEVPFQRQQIWKTDKSSALIESIIMNVPIPPLYFAEEENGDWLVLDGLQRLSSILNYFDNEFALTKLEVLKDLEKVKYKDLPPKSKSLLNDGLLRVNIIRKDSHKDIKYDIFMRLNRGAVTLNYQELRNCLYRGNLNDAAKELCSENEDFLKILGATKPDKRYLDVELVIRYFAISDNVRLNDNDEYELYDYRSKLVQYLNDYMDNHKDCTLEEKQIFKDRFNDTIEKVVAVFGHDNAFRDPTVESRKLYKPIFDFIMPSFERYDLQKLISDKQLILDAYKEFLSVTTNHDTISFRTSDKDMVNKRINGWFKILENALSL